MDGFLIMPSIRTGEQVRAWLRQHGKTVQSFAHEHALSPWICYRLIDGRLVGNYGEAHRAAVLLGMKEGVIPGIDAGGADTGQPVAGTAP